MGVLVERPKSRNIFLTQIKDANMLFWPASLGQKKKYYKIWRQHFYLLHADRDSFKIFPRLFPLP